MEVRKEERPADHISHLRLVGLLPITVDSEIFARISFSQNFASAKFCENENLAKWRNHCH